MKTKEQRETELDTKRLDWLEKSMGIAGHAKTYLGSSYFAHAHAQGDKYEAAFSIRDAIDAAMGCDSSHNAKDSRGA